MHTPPLCPSYHRHAPHHLRSLNPRPLPHLQRLYLLHPPPYLPTQSAFHLRNLCNPRFRQEDGRGLDERERFDCGIRDIRLGKIAQLPVVHGLDLLPRPAAFDFGLFAESLLRFGAGRAQGLLSPVVGIPLALRALPVV